MIVLDTNVISELLRPRPNRGVVAWVDAQPSAVLHLTAVTVGELVYGVARLPNGRRRMALALAVEAVISEDFAHRVLPYDEAAARHLGDIAAHRDRLGRPISTADAQISAICRSHGAAVATRNVDDFEEIGVEVIDPWNP